MLGGSCRWEMAQPVEALKRPAPQLSTNHARVTKAALYPEWTRSNYLRALLSASCTAKHTSSNDLLQATGTILLAHPLRQA